MAVRLCCEINITLVPLFKRKLCMSLLEDKCVSIHCYMSSCRYLRCEKHLTIPQLAGLFLCVCLCERSTLIKHKIKTITTANQIQKQKQKGCNNGETRTKGNYVAHSSSNSNSSNNKAMFCRFQTKAMLQTLVTIV